MHRNLQIRCLLTPDFGDLDSDYSGGFLVWLLMSDAQTGLISIYDIARR
jgi:hypothetical protein